MAHVLDTQGIVTELEKIINEAEKYIVLISPFLRISESNYNRLKRATEHGVSVVLIYGKKETSEAEKFKTFQNCKILFCENLHAKCYCNENDMIISSLNLHECSEHNFELGVGFSNDKKDGAMYEETSRKINQIYQNSEIIWGESRVNFYATNINTGFCLNCGQGIGFNPTRPFCYNCYTQIRKENNDIKNLRFQYCHMCRKRTNYYTSEDKPLCRECWNNWNS